MSSTFDKDHRSVKKVRNDNSRVKWFNRRQSQSRNWLSRYAGYHGPRLVISFEAADVSFTVHQHQYPSDHIVFVDFGPWIVTRVLIIRTLTSSRSVAYVICNCKPGIQENKRNETEKNNPSRRHLWFASGEISLNSLYWCPFAETTPYMSTMRKVEYNKQVFVA